MSQDPIPITVPLLDSEEQDAACAAIQSGWITQGPKVAEFEKQIADYCGVEHAVAVSSCTAALHLSLLALGVGPDDEVICPSMSFIATANAIRVTGATPVFAEVDPQTFNLDPEAAEAAITDRTKALLPVHQIGMPANMDRFTAIASKHGLPVIEDAACALGSRYKGQAIGGHSVAVCFSFHPRKVITTGEGGMITTPDARLADKLRLLRHHGMNLSDTQRHGTTKVMIERYECVGFNYRMSDIAAAIGIAQMKKLPRILQRRREIAARYAEALAGQDLIEAPHVPEACEPNYQSYAVTLAPDNSIDRDSLIQYLLDHGIAAKPGIMLAHREPAYEKISASQASLPQSERAHGRSLLLPIYPQMTDAQQDKIIAVLNQACKNPSGS